MSENPKKSNKKSKLKDVVPIKNSSFKNDDSTDEIENSEIVEIREELEEINPHVFDGLDEIKRGEVLQTVSRMTLRVTQSHHSGPLPSAETIIKYDAVIPNGADRIMIMAEKQQDHRMAMEKKAISSQLNQSLVGQIFGFFLCLFALSLATYLGLNGHEAIGSVIGGTTILGLAGIFVLGKKDNPKPEDKKDNKKQLSKKSEEEKEE